MESLTRRRTSGVFARQALYYWWLAVTLLILVGGCARVVLEELRIDGIVALQGAGAFANAGTTVSMETGRSVQSLSNGSYRIDGLALGGEPLALRCHHAGWADTTIVLDPSHLAGSPGPPLTYKAPNITLRPAAAPPGLPK